jgi:5'-3' exonuclease
MGIKHFFGWFMKNNGGSLKPLAKRKGVPLKFDTPIDTLALDLNGMFHPSAQKIFQYGSHKVNAKRLLPVGRLESNKSKYVECFKDVCRSIESMVKLIQPRKRLFLCVDGPAPYAKCTQQRSRRYKSAMENEVSEFDSCQISPGTRFMHYLNDYVQWFVRCKVQTGEWSHLDIIFSSEKVPGEGEHKCMHLFKTVCDPEETKLIYGLDADLIMLCLATKLDNIYVLRENINSNDEIFLIHINRFQQHLHDILETNSCIEDFIFMCFLVGNDFLPNLPPFITNILRPISVRSKMFSLSNS